MIAVSSPVLDSLRQRIRALEEGDRRYAPTIPIARPVDLRLPHGGLPAACVHEVKGRNLANAIAFSAILSARVAGGGRIVYLTPDRSLHPLGLLPYGIQLEQIVQVSSKRPQDLVWALLEVLRCASVGAVIALLSGLDLTESRRLQLAAESSGVTAFLAGHAASPPNASATTRWHISPFVNNPQNRRFDEPAWNLDLLYCSGGRPGKWTLEWRGQKLHPLGPG